MRRSYKIVAVAVGAALLVGVLGIGAAFAADPPTPAGYHQAMFTRVAEILGVDQQKLSDAFIQARTEQVDQAVKDGRLTQQQADWMKQRMQQAGFGPGMRGGPGFGPGFGPGMRGGPMHGPGFGPGFGPGSGPGPWGPAPSR